MRLGSDDERCVWIHGSSRTMYDGQRVIRKAIKRSDECTPESKGIEYSAEGPRILLSNKKCLTGIKLGVNSYGRVLLHALASSG